MSWPMGAPVPWNPNAMMTPDMNNMNMGSMTPEQWSMMQQQNWQQWSQWQQQYAQWHKQYGDKYAQQMQSYNMGGIPPPPSTAGPQPPPPPDKPPPPPPPHENNQPLFGSKTQPAPVPPPPQRTANFSNTNPIPTNINTNTAQQWSSNNEPKPTPPSVNSEALKKLAEEERLFDIQFKKWEEEIDKWRKENVNHPDKQAYKEYEQRFEACRAQLMERREQMKQKRSRLMNTTVNPNVPNSTIPTMSAPQNNYDQGSNFSHPSYNQLKMPNTANSHKQPEPMPPVQNRSNNITINTQDSFDSYKKSDVSYSSQNNVPGHTDTSFLPTSSSSKGIPGLDLVPEPIVPSNQPEVIDITEEANQKQGPDYSTISQGINSILGDEKIMNILSMMRGDTSQNAPVTNNQNNTQQQNHSNQQRPSYQMASDSQYPTSSGMQQGQYYDQNASYGGNNMRPGNMGYNNQGMRPGGPNMGPGGPNMGPGGPNMGPGGPNMGPGGPNTGPGGPNMGPGGPNMGPGGPIMGPGGPIMGPGGHNMGPGGPNIGPGGPNMRLGGPNMRPGGPNMGPGGPNIRQGGPNMGPGGPNMGPRAPNMGPGGPNMGTNSAQRPNGPEMRHDGQNMRPSGPSMQFGMQQGNQNYRFSGPNNQGPNEGQQQQFNNGPRPLMQTLVQRPSRPLQENVPPQHTQNANTFYEEQETPTNENIPPIVNQKPRPKWVEEPLFTPSIVVEYEHKPLRLKARDFIDPVHTFDYNHKSKDDDLRRKAIEKAEELFVRKPRREREEDDERYSRDLFYRDERRPAREMRDDRLSDYRERPREEVWNDFPRERDRTRDVDRLRDLERPRDLERHRDLERPREEFDRRRDDRYDERRRDDRDRLRRDDFRDHRDRDEYRDFRRRDDKDFHRDRNRDMKRSDSRNRSRSRDRDSRKRGLSRESEASSYSKKSKDVNLTNKHIVMIDDLLEPPGRDMRPAKIVIILRGPPGSGKSYLAKLIRDREAEYGGTARVMSIDDYFMQEGEIEEKDPITGKIVKKPTLKYEYDESSEEIYITSLKRAFKRSLTDGYFSFLIYDAVNETLKSYADIWNYARQNCFQVYICTMELDAQACFKRNIHNRSLSDIETICARFFSTPDHHIQLDPTTLLQNAAITDVQMEDVEIVEEVEPEVENIFTSKWEKMDDANQLARLDGTSKPLRSSQISMEDYLQLDEWKPNVAKPGKKTVRWADIEERREQEKMRAIGFVVGKTDWNRMTDPTMGSSALTQTKYIERVKKKF